MEWLRLRVKDIDFSYNQIIVRDGKGEKDRVTPLAQSVKQPLQQHLVKVKELHEADLKAGYGAVYLPYALEGKYPNANRHWAGSMSSPLHKSRSIRAQASGDGITSMRQCCRKP
jgi:integrase